MNRLLRYPRLSNLSLDENRDHKFAANQALAVYGANTVYTFIPKNACSTLRYSLAIHNGFLRLGDDPSWIGQNNKVFVADQRMLIECDYNFVVFRCPYRRLASSYLDKVVKGDAYARVLLAKSSAPSDLAAVTRDDILKLTFRDFARLCMAPRSKTIDFHWIPQVAFLVYEDYDDWFSVENFAAATDKLSKIGLTVHDTRELIPHSTYLLTKIEGNFSQVPASKIAQLRSEGKVPDYASLYDDETKAIVKSAYARDVRLYSDKIGTESLLFR